MSLSSPSESSKKATCSSPSENEQNAIDSIIHEAVPLSVYVCKSISDDTNDVQVQSKTSHTDLHATVTSRSLKRKSRVYSVDGAEGNDLLCRPITAIVRVAAFKEILSSLTSDQRDRIISVGFGGLLKIDFTKPSDDMNSWLIDCFDPVSRFFMLDERSYFVVTPNDIHDLYLLPRNQGTPVPLYCHSTKSESQEYSDMRRSFLSSLGSDDKDHVRYPSLVRKLKSLKDASDDFIRFFVLAAYCMILDPDSGGKVDFRVLKAVKDVDKIIEFDWCSTVLDKICAGIKSLKDDDKKKKKIAKLKVNEVNKDDDNKKEKIAKLMVNVVNDDGNNNNSNINNNNSNNNNSNNNKKKKKGNMKLKVNVAGSLISLQLIYFQHVAFRKAFSPTSLPLIQHWSGDLINKRIKLERQSNSFGLGVVSLDSVCSKEVCKNHLIDMSTFQICTQPTSDVKKSSPTPTSHARDHCVDAPTPSYRTISIPNGDSGDLDFDVEVEILKDGLDIKNYEDDLKDVEVVKDATILELQASTELLTSDNELHKKETLDYIQHKVGSAASVYIAFSRNSTLKEKHFKTASNLVGLVAFLAMAPSTLLSRSLAEYLGEDQMLAIVCQSTVKNSMEYTSALESIASELKRDIEGRCRLIFLGDIRAYSGDINESDPQRRLCIPKPKLPDGTTPLGFLGHAVNMIDVDETKTANGYGLRETLFYRLFGELQVYDSTENMTQAHECIDKDGAVSLDGGVISGNGVFSYGCKPVDVMFPVTEVDNWLIAPPESEENKPLI